MESYKDYKMNSIHKYVLLLAILIQSLAGFSQKNLGDTAAEADKPPVVESRSEKSTLVKDIFIEQAEAYITSEQSIDCGVYDELTTNKTYKFFISHHVTLYNGEPTISRARIEAINIEVNRIYANAGIRFVDCGENDEFYPEHGNPSVKLSYYETEYKSRLSKGAINIFWGNPCFDANNFGLAGAHDVQKRIIIMDGSDPFSGYDDKRHFALAHELGHHIGLAHTHGDENNVSGTDELVTRIPGDRNCENAGDGLCDTPADPNVWSNCKYAGSPTDENGDYYDPDPANIMSYSDVASPGTCAVSFSHCQNKKMRYHAEYYEPSGIELTQFVQSISNDLDGVNKTYNYPVITADNSITGSSYVRYNGMAYVILKPGFHVSAGADFKARIDFDCKDPNIPEAKITGNNQMLIDKNNSGDDNITVSPTPFISTMNVTFSLKQSSKTRIWIQNVFGEDILNLETGMYEKGNYNKQFEMAELPAGIYFLVFESNSFIQTKKIIKMD